MATVFDPSQTPLASEGYQNINNIIDNGGFDVWQRGTSFTNIGTQYTADRWQMGVAGSAPTATITKETSVTDNTAAALKWNVTSNAGNSQAYFLQYIENFAAYRGKTVTVTIRSQQSATGFFLGIYDGVSATSIPIGVNAGYTTYSLTVTLSSVASSLFVFWGNNTGPVPVGTFYLDSVMMTIGSTSVPFVPTNLEVDLARCQRFFYATPGINNVAIAQGHCRATTGTNYVIRFPVPMRVGPTLTVNNPTNFATWNAGGANLAILTVTNAGAAANSDFFLLEATVASGLVVGNSTILLTTNANAQLFFSADL